ncbi:Uncharacterised protein [Vibrio cholerae]|nr:Uncharacterised protein [Vibrio cholerae]
MTGQAKILQKSISTPSIANLSWSKIATSMG